MHRVTEVWEDCCALVIHMFSFLQRQANRLFSCFTFLVHVLQLDVIISLRVWLNELALKSSSFWDLGIEALATVGRVWRGVLTRGCFTWEIKENTGRRCTFFVHSEARCSGFWDLFELITVASCGKWPWLICDKGNMVFQYAYGVPPSVSILFRL